MYKYEYVTIYSDSIIASKFTEHRNIINKYAQKGYRFVDAIPIKTRGHGMIVKMDLVFEREE